MRANAALAVLGLVLATPGMAEVRVTPLGQQEQGRALPVHVVGRVQDVGTADQPRFRRQWPGTYFETQFNGRSAAFRVGPGKVSLRVTLDGDQPVALTSPMPGLYRVEAGRAGAHRLRVQVVSESQQEPTEFGGFFALGTTRPVANGRVGRPVQIEFIGDSHTVGYGNTSATQQCSQAEVWATTDTSQSPGAILAGRFGADYQVNAISGRGVVRNYNGSGGDTLPRAYPYALFDRATAVAPGGWKPQVVVIALGTNDFSTPLKPEEPWRDRDALHADFEQSYARFVADLRRRYPDARFVLWATDMANGEIAAEVERAYQRIRASGETRIDFVRVPGLSFSACNSHPSLADDRRIADLLQPVVAKYLPPRLDQDGVRGQKMRQ